MLDVNDNPRVKKKICLKEYKKKKQYEASNIKCF